MWRVVFIVVVVVIILMLMIVPGLLADEGKAVRLLEESGYTDIKVKSRSFLLVSCQGGEKSDSAKFKIEATNPIGKRVTVNVYVGWPFKGATLRGN